MPSITGMARCYRRARYAAAMRPTTLTVLAAALLSSSAGAQTPAPAAARETPASPKTPLVAYPHPLITEVLYAVPTGAAGDANKDGVRDTNGDEFIELVNPHDRPINLRGYMLTGKSPEAPAPGKKFTVLKFVFPACELAPGEVAVVFNGHAAAWTGPLGDTTRAAAANSAFSGARLFTMNIDSARLGLANKTDYVLLTAPSGERIHCIKWGDIKPPDKVALVETAPEVNGQSVMRRTTTGELEPHPPLDGKRYSPGRFPLDKPDASSTVNEPTKPPTAPSHAPKRDPVGPPK
jgi:hypothetical protein